jgi:ADP-ribose pyrophosphatase YjhB (NUDIX family)
MSDAETERSERIRPVEILDAAGRLVAVLSAEEAARQKLPHKTVVVLLFDEAGRLHLRRIAAPGTNARRWDTPARGPMLAGESAQDAASRTLEEALGIHSERLRLLAQLTPAPEYGNEFLHVYTLTRPETLVASAGEPEAGDYAFTTEEMNCLLRDFRELVSPRLLALAEALNLKGLWRRRP